MEKYDGKTIKILESKKNEEHGKVVDKEIQSILFENKNGKYYKKIRYIATYEDGTKSSDYESFTISMEEYTKITKL